MLRSLSASLAIVLLGCGPSLRMEHQSATFFEQCHATDADPRATNDQRHSCWTAWVDYYAEGQPPERVSYAEDRCQALERGEALPPLPGLGPAVDGQLTTSYLALTADSSPEDGASSEEHDQTADGAHDATTEDVGADGATSGAAGDDADRRLAPPASDTTSACSPVCVPQWHACTARCEGEGRDCIGACETDYRTCLGGCY